MENERNEHAALRGPAAVLSCESLCLGYEKREVLHGLSFELHEGECLCVLGENGAGKSTLMKCLFGIYSVDSGEFILDGKKIHFTGSKQAMNNGVSMVHQELIQVPTRSVMENFWLGRFPGFPPPFVNHVKM